MPMDVVDHEINGAEMQFVAVELGGGGLFGKLLGAGKRLVTGESLFTTVYTNQGSGKRRVAFAAPYPGKILAMAACSAESSATKTDGRLRDRASRHLRDEKRM